MGRSFSITRCYPYSSARPVGHKTIDPTPPYCGMALSAKPHAYVPMCGVMHEKHRGRMILLASAMLLVPP